MQDLDGIKKSYKECADTRIPAWRKMNKNDLCNKYIAAESAYISEGYLAAIIYLYWAKINTFWVRSRPAATKEDCYEWLVESIMYALDKRQWTDKDNKLYDDPNAPDKVINRKLLSTRLTFFQTLYRDKRKISVDTSSLESLEELWFVTDFPSKKTSIEQSDIDIWVSDLVTGAFNRKDYFQAFLIDCIVHGDCFDKHQFSVKKLSKELRNLTSDYCMIFADQYGYVIEQVKKAASYILEIPPQDLEEKIEDTLTTLKRRLGHVGKSAGL